jgi:hypothetical protein
MRRQLRTRFWLEVALSSASGMLFFLTLFWRDWIEVTSGFDPDGHSGAAERVVVVALFVVALTCALLARVEWRRPAPAT